MARFRSIKLRWLQGHLGEVAGGPSPGFFVPPPDAGWQPAINVYRCERSFSICVDLAGVARDQIELTAEPARLRLRGFRAAPVPAECHGAPARILAMEIDAGAFERELRLPPEVDISQITAEQEDGWLWIHLPIR